MKYDNLLKRIIGTKVILINAKNNKTVSIDKNGELFWDSFSRHKYDNRKTIKYLKSQYPSNYKDHIQKDFFGFLDSIEVLFKNSNPKSPIARIDKKETLVDFIENENVLQKVYLELTERCPYNCVHCFCPRDSQEQEMSASEIKSYLDQLFELGTLFLTITGGEPLIRKDFDEIYVYAKKRGFLINLFTNAFLIDESKISLFREYLPYNIDITLYGRSKNTYETYVQKRHSFKIFCNNLEKLKNNNIPYRLKTPISKINLKEVDLLISFAERHCDNYNYTPFITSKLNGDRSPLKYRCSPKEIVDIEDKDPQKREEWIKVINNKSDKESICTGLKCSQGLTDIVIDAYGNAFFCNLLRYRGINLKGHTIKYCWDYLIRQREFFNEIVRDSECATCDLWYICNWCPGYSLLENGTLNDKVNYFCELNKERFKKYKEDIEALV